MHRISYVFFVYYFYRNQDKMSIVKTVIRVPSQGTSYSIPGEWTADQVKTNYASNIQGLNAMNAETTDDTEAPEGTVRTITFTERSGNKG